MVLGIDPKVDYAFKWLFGNESWLQPPINLLNAILSQERREPVVTINILNPFNQISAQDEKLSILDIKARDQLGRQFNIEMQMTTPAGLLQRITYYWATFYTDQLGSGQGYELLKPTILVCFVDGVVFRDSPLYHHVFRIMDASHTVTLTGDFEIHIFELPKFKLTVDQLTTPLEAWLYFLRHADTLDSENLPAILDTEEFREATEALTMLRHIDLQKEIYEGRVKAQRDAVTMKNFVAGMESTLTETQGTLTETQGTLTETQGTLTETRGTLAETQGTLTETQGTLAETRYDLAAARQAAAHALEKGAVIGRIEALQELLGRDVRPRAELDQMTLEHLQALAAQLRRELLG